MGKKRRKKKPLPPRVKRLKRPARLRAARDWMVKYEGKNILRGYCKHFGVDWRCAAKELTMLGVKLDPEYLQQRERDEAALARSRKRKRQARLATTDQDWPSHESELDAYVAEDYAALYAMECARNEIPSESRRRPGARCLSSNLPEERSLVGDDV